VIVPSFFLRFLDGNETDDDDDDDEGEGDDDAGIFPSRSHPEGNVFSLNYRWSIMTATVDVGFYCTNVQFEKTSARLAAKICSTPVC